MRYTPIALLLLLAACDRPECRNTNPIFADNPVTSRAYKAELMHQLTAAKNVRFWIDTFSEQNNRMYMNVFIQNGELCAEQPFDITDTKNLDQYKNAKGAGYRGAELFRLSYTMDSTANDIRFILNDVKKIID